MVKIFEKNLTFEMFLLSSKLFSSSELWLARFVCFVSLFDIRSFRSRCKLVSPSSSKAFKFAPFSTNISIMGTLNWVTAKSSGVCFLLLRISMSALKEINCLTQSVCPLSAAKCNPEKPSALRTFFISGHLHRILCIPLDKKKNIN